jgi:ABC-type metal ion transport system, periplasmic component/surface adhesin
MPRKSLAIVALASTSLLLLAGCSGTSTPDASGSASADGKLVVVASTNVYGDIASTIGGDRVEVSSIISSSAQDPHEYEATAQDQLTISRADLIIENGGGYDAFIDSMIESTGTDAPVITAVEFSHAYPGADEHDDDAETDDHTDEAEADDHEGHDHIEGFNEHVWYDAHTIAHVAEHISEELSELDPEGASTYEANYKTFAEGIEGIESSLADLKAQYAGEKIFVTEPVPLYMTEAAGLVNVTPAAFSEAVEEGQDVAPATLLEALAILGAGDVKALFVNAQTGGTETDQAVAAAKEASVPIIEVTEVLPEGDSYLSWMQANVKTLATTLAE